MVQQGSDLTADVRQTRSRINTTRVEREESRGRDSESCSSSRVRDELMIVAPTRRVTRAKRIEQNVNAEPRLRLERCENNTQGNRGSMAAQIGIEESGMMREIRYRAIQGATDEAFRGDRKSVV